MRFCAICRSDVPLHRYNRDQAVLTKCGHVFHRPCINRWLKCDKIDQWLTSDNTAVLCPMCKQEIDKDNIFQLLGFGKSLKKPSFAYKTFYFFLLETIVINIFLFQYLVDESKEVLSDEYEQNCEKKGNFDCI